VRPIVVDSSVWIDFYRGVETAAVAELRAILGEREVLLPDLVLMEVLQGFRVVREIRAAEAYFADLVPVALGGEDRARRAAANYRLLRGVGVNPRSSIDVLIATFCLDQAAHLLASDRDFTLMAPHLGLVLHGPSMH